ncbi:hypothetical protein V3C40_01155 [Janthinobacterium sp. LS2A]|uniref:hypothetical protein n=1 Tax=Janthinobacterium sp. LS2A TaxID=3118590 RepID=UPI002F944427
MKQIGYGLLALGIFLAIFALTMDVGIHLQVTQLDMTVANLDRISQRLNYIILSGVFSVMGVMLIGFDSLKVLPERENTTMRTSQQDIPKEKIKAPGPVTSVSICPSCKFMGEGDAEQCGRCGKNYS